MKSQHNNFPSTQLRMLTYVLVFFIVLAIAVQVTFAQDEAEPSEDEIILMEAIIFTETPVVTEEENDDSEVPVTPEPTLLTPTAIITEAPPLIETQTPEVILLPEMSETPLPQPIESLEPTATEEAAVMVETELPTEIVATQTEDAQSAPELSPTEPATTLPQDVTATEVVLTPAPEATEIVETLPQETATEIAPASDTTVTEDAPVSEPEAPAMPEVEAVAVSQLYGHIDSALPLANDDITITLRGASMEQTISVQSNGSFVAELPFGSYEITVSAPLHVPYVTDVFIADEPLVLPIIMLTGGDVDGSGRIDMGDVNTLVDNFGQPFPAGELTGDNVIDIRDLTIVGANMQSGH